MSDAIDVYRRLSEAVDDVDRLINTTERRINRRTAPGDDRWIDPFSVIDQHGQPVLAPLIIARTTALAALATLEAALR